MESMSPWNSLEVAKLAVAVLTPVTVVVLGIVFNWRLHKIESGRDDARRKQDAREKDERDELERRHTPHIEFYIDCHLFGPHHGKYAAEFILTANNRGITKHEFKNVTLRVRGIKRNEPLSFWVKRYEHRLEFPIAILQDEARPKGWNYIFVEPGVTQRISFITIIDEDIQYITAQAHFEYEQYRPHTTERMFELRPRDARFCGVIPTTEQAAQGTQN